MKKRIATGNDAVMTDKEVRNLLEAAIAQAGSMKQLALDWGVSAQYLCDLRKGRRTWSDAILWRLGLRKEVTYTDVKRKARPGSD